LPLEWTAGKKESGGAVAEQRISEAKGLGWRTPGAFRTVAISLAAPLPLGAAHADSSQAGLPVAALVRPSCVVSSRGAQGVPTGATVSCTSATPVSISVERQPARRADGAPSGPRAGAVRVTVTY
jgi:hypothetical protein